MIITFLDAVLFVLYFCLLFFSIFWLLVLFSDEKPKEKRKMTKYPLFTAIVPAYNEEESIEETLNSLCNLDYPIEKMEIIVVNDGSQDHTKDVVERFIQQSSHKITLINQENSGKGRAMNKGLEKAQGEFFACLDADSFVAPNALKVMLPLFEDDARVAAVCPLLKVKNPTTTLLKIQWCEYIINMFYRFLNAKVDSIHVTPGPFSVYRTEVVKNLGGYDEKTITEDLEIAIRLQKYNYRLLHTYDTIVETESPHTWLALFKQRVRWYKGSVDNTWTYKNLLFNKKYGDFGLMRMPTILFSGVAALILTGALLHSLLKSAYYNFLALQAVNFDIITLLKNLTFHFNYLSLPLFKMVIAFTVFALSFLIMIYSFKIVKEKITHYGRTWTSLITYLFIYSLFLTTVWMYISYLLIKKKKNTW